ncbi:hypothetical protein [Polaribacter sp. SA4-12]|uniref:hypothetical protein n=1 Tax=Polaribacter sp. SA4-12 TaxID=1312072 RepID=UPI000B559C50|nr:hypothetical protein [Polaribacter sp. SA4-12]ARV14790.1 hypothetical protein BTO07_06340 [Polaribacter sp. SA4-12]
MKKRKYLLIIILFTSMFMIESCGPVVFSSRLEIPPPPWFYPNRIETVRYVYFPEHNIYYDLSLRSYIYLKNKAWLTVKVLPSQYRSIDLKRSRFVRIKNYRGDNITNYHQGDNTKRRGTSLQTSRRSKRN